MTSVRLELLAERHLRSIATLVGDAETLRFTRIPSPLPPGFVETWLARYEEGRREGTREAWAVLDAGDGRLLGLGFAPAIDRVTRTMELGYAVAPESRGRGVATETLRLLTEWAFEQGAMRLELLIAVPNEASKKVAGRCGYIREGVLRSYHLKGDERIDTEIWSRLPGDP